MKNASDRILPLAAIRPLLDICPPPHAVPSPRFRPKSISPVFSITVSVIFYELPVARVYSICSTFSRQTFRGRAQQVASAFLDPPTFFYLIPLQKTDKETDDTKRGNLPGFRLLPGANTNNNKYFCHVFGELPSFGAMVVESTTADRVNRCPRFLIIRADYYSSYSTSPQARIRCVYVLIQGQGWGYDQLTRVRVEVLMMHPHPFTVVFPCAFNSQRICFCL